MARIKHIAARLENWALWRSRMDGNGLGFHSINVLAVDVWCRNTYNGVQIPHIESDAEEIDKAVQSLKPGRQHLHEVLCMHYLQYLSVQEVAVRLGRAVSTVHANLASADAAIAEWLRADKERRETQEALRRGREWVSRQ